MNSLQTVPPMYSDSTALPDPDTQSEFYADIPTKRLLAWLVDMVLIAVVSAIIVPFTAFTGLFFFPALMLVVGFLYRTITLTTSSATWGMRLFSIEFRDRTGRTFDFGSAILHTLGYHISISVFPLQIVSIILMLTSARKQGLTDYFMGSVAINRPARY
ncbi:RDD family protein [Shimia thalassica]|uniref:RDD family protein n=1 Tax=Shimia thalassica TaxID=1715693 RepID=A0A0P1I8X7_9RHOB|nr:RDD family protein [Shimia thalassica]MDO6483127.1 RDD family protein [Shimia thalassica]MDO6504962.1 RDD family protein [Shimia thalassica]MDO6523308.1 RDD family protein [Shimia thalassica]MDO6800234.1 RDD family protein [Shimia thalassica]MDP2495816.1 RDD family protein [Shimia thalassica]